MATETKGKKTYRVVDMVTENVIGSFNEQEAAEALLKDLRDVERGTATSKYGIMITEQTLLTETV